SRRAPPSGQRRPLSQPRGSPRRGPSEGPRRPPRWTTPGEARLRPREHDQSSSPSMASFDFLDAFFLLSEDDAEDEDPELLVFTSEGETALPVVDGTTMSACCSVPGFLVSWPTTRSMMSSFS